VTPDTLGHVSARVARLSELDDIPVAGCHLRPVRRPLGITAFGMNAYTADAGEQLIEAHDETGSGAGGHEELYLVVTGHATFTVAGEEIDAAAGTMVFVPEPGDRREAVATQDGTAAVVIGGPAGAAGPVSPWEWSFAAAAMTQRGEWREAYDFAAQGLEAHPDNPHLAYNLACYASMSGRPELALEHLRVAFAGDERTRKWAAEDSDLDPIRDDPAYPAA
jgi:hypothetical protein